MKIFLSLSIFALLSLIAVFTTVFASAIIEREEGVDVIYTSSVKAVIFSHKAHTEDIGLQCEWCHDATFEMEALAMEAERDFNMDSLCNETYCGTCHNGDVSFSTTEQCARCHIGQKGYDRLVAEGEIDIEESGEGDTVVQKDAKTSFPKFDVAKMERLKERNRALQEMVEAEYFPEEITLDDFGPRNLSVFSHEKHLTREKLQCTMCHPNTFIMKAGDKAVRKGRLTMQQMEKGKYCGTCHNGEDAFSVSEKQYCKKCHPRR